MFLIYDINGHPPDIKTSCSVHGWNIICKLVQQTVNMENKISVCVHYNLNQLLNDLTDVDSMISFKNVFYIISLDKERTPHINLNPPKALGPDEHNM